MFICPECRSIYHQELELCERDRERLVPVQANQNPRTYPLLNTELDGRYHLIGGLGQGGVGTVYLANHIHLDQLSAVKFLDIDQLGQADDEQREESLQDFVKEAKLSMLIRHDSVVRVMDYGVYEGSPFLVMEYIPGPSLLRQMSNSPLLSLQQSVNILRQLADALNAFHERKLVHRDLKPANVIVDPRDNGKVTLVDLGLVKDLSSEARSSTHPLALRGTPGYLAPEQVPSWVLSSAGVEVQGEKQQVDARVDIYALGVLAYELIGGQPPYPKGLSPTKVIIHTCTQEPPSIESIRPEVLDYPGLAPLIKSMMARNPQERPKDGREVMQRIDELLEDAQDPAALREELERAQSALARRLSASSGAPFSHELSALSGAEEPSPVLITPPPSLGAHSTSQAAVTPSPSSLQPPSGALIAPPPYQSPSGSYPVGAYPSGAYPSSGSVSHQASPPPFKAPYQEPSALDSFSEDVETAYTLIREDDFSTDHETRFTAQDSPNKKGVNTWLMIGLVVVIGTALGLLMPLSQPKTPKGTQLKAKVLSLRPQRQDATSQPLSAAQRAQDAPPALPAPIAEPQPTQALADPLKDEERGRDDFVFDEPDNIATPTSTSSTSSTSDKPPARAQKKRPPSQALTQKQTQRPSRKRSRSVKPPVTKTEPKPEVSQHREFDQTMLNALVVQIGQDPPERARRRIKQHLKQLPPNSPHKQDLLLLLDSVKGP